MKKVIFLISMIVATIVACVPVPVKAQDLAHEYVVATLTTPIGRYLNVGQKNFISVQATGARYQITASFPSTATMASIIVAGNYVAQTGTATLSAITATLLPNATGTYNLGSASKGWQDLFLTRNALIGGTLGVTGVTTAAAISATTVAASSTVSGTYWTGTATDTVTAAPIGSIIFKISDSTFYGKIRATGTKGARWKKLN